MRTDLEVKAEADDERLVQETVVELEGVRVVNHGVSDTRVELRARAVVDRAREVNVDVLGVEIGDIRAENAVVEPTGGDSANVGVRHIVRDLILLCGQNQRGRRGSRMESHGRPGRGSAARRSPSHRAKIRQPSP